MTVLSIDTWKTNAELIADCAALGYLRKEWLTLDPTYGYGTFWKVWRPHNLIATDLDPRKSLWGASGVDFRYLPWVDRHFDSVVFDPPYKLNGRPDPEEERYGVHVPTPWRDRMQLCRDGITECARVLGDGFLLVKCQDQVCSGKKRWQTVDFIGHAKTLGLGLVDRFDFMGGVRPQPSNKRQVHSWAVSSQLLVFKRGWDWS